MPNSEDPTQAPSPELAPPSGFGSWLAYAVSTIDTRRLLLEHQDGHQPQWPHRVESAMIVQAAQRELTMSLATAGFSGREATAGAITLEHARGYLWKVMGDISEEKWAAGWLVDLELILWRALKDPSSRDLLPLERVSLDYFSQLAGGWWSTYDKFLVWEDWHRFVAQAESAKASPGA